MGEKMTVFSLFDFSQEEEEREREREKTCSPPPPLFFLKRERKTCFFSHQNHTHGAAREREEQAKRGKRRIEGPPSCVISSRLREREKILSKIKNAKLLPFFLLVFCFPHVPL